MAESFSDLGVPVFLADMKGDISGLAKVGSDTDFISNKLFRKYQIQVYPGDIFSWLDNFVKNLDAIKRIAKAYNKNNIVKKTNFLIKKIENG